MNTDTPIIEIQNLTRRYGKLDAVDRPVVKRGAPANAMAFSAVTAQGKTTTIKCLLNLTRPDSGSVRVFGLDPQRNEVAVKSRLRVCAGRGRVLSVDDRARYVGILRLVPPALEP